MATKDAIIQGVVAEIGRVDLLADAAIWFDDIYNVVNSYSGWSYLQVLASRACVADTYKYSLPSDFRTANLIYCDTSSSSSTKLIRYGLTEFVRRHPRIESEGASIPREYTTYNLQLMIAPKPSSASYVLKIVYIYDPPALTGGQTPIIPDKWLNVLRLGLRGHAYSRIREFDKAKATFDEFVSYMKLMVKEDDIGFTDDLYMQPFGGAKQVTGNYWAIPDIKAMP